MIKAIDHSRPRGAGENLYDFECEGCGRVSSDFATLDDKRRLCVCGQTMKRLFPLSASYQPFKPYFDEALGVDITGARQKSQVMKLMGVLEAGDKKGGARDFDEDASVVIDDSPEPIGRTVDDFLHSEDARRDDKEKFAYSVDGSDTFKPAVYEPSRSMKRKSRLSKDSTIDSRINRLSNKSAVVA